MKTKCNQYITFGNLKRGPKSFYFNLRHKGSKHINFNSSNCSMFT
uniref:Uncharacterized protein n=1 Tax=Rhizophora mucronata TaxID=61149 RepID=A0A2P2N9C7_RHIMU